MLWDQPYLQPPSTSLLLGTDPQSFYASSGLTVTLGLNVHKPHSWPSCSTSYHLDRGHWFHSSWTERYEHGATDLQPWALLLCCLTLINMRGLLTPPLAWPGLLLKNRGLNQEISTRAPVLFLNQEKNRAEPKPREDRHCMWALMFC